MAGFVVFLLVIIMGTAFMRCAAARRYHNDTKNEQHQAATNQAQNKLPQLTGLREAVLQFRHFVSVCHVLCVTG